MTHKISKGITAFLLRKNKITEADFEVCEYGYSIIIGETFQTIILILIGLFLNRIWETITYLLVFISVRRHAGGFHASKRIYCVILTTILYLIAIFLTDFLLGLSKENIKMIITVLIVISTALIIAFAPVSVPWKSKLPNSDAINKRRAAIYSIIYSIIAIAAFNYLSNISMIISLAFAEILLMIIVELTYRRMPFRAARGHSISHKGE